MGKVRSGRRPREVGLEDGRENTRDSGARFYIIPVHYDTPSRVPEYASGKSPMPVPREPPESVFGQRRVWYSRQPWEQAGTHFSG